MHFGSVSSENLKMEKNDRPIPDMMFRHLQNDKFRMILVGEDKNKNKYSESSENKKVEVCINCHRENDHKPLMKPRWNDLVHLYRMIYPFVCSSVCNCPFVCLSITGFFWLLYLFIKI